MRRSDGEAVELTDGSDWCEVSGVGGHTTALGWQRRERRNGAKERSMSNFQLPTFKGGKWRGGLLDFDGSRAAWGERQQASAVHVGIGP